MRLIGLDPGLRADRLGRDRCRRQPAAPCRARRGQGAADGSLAERLCQLFDGIAAVVAAQQPLEAAVEETFVNVNPGSTLKLGQARGVVCWRRRAPACRCSSTPPTW
jgi:crossover junction endodeoxyribonuclease RuvC